MSFAAIKTHARRYGIYRHARWLHRHLVNRQELYNFRESVSFYSALLKPGSLCFDVGANYGTKSEVLLKLGAKVIAFEPQYDCLKELEARLCPHPRMVVVNVALGRIPGRMPLYVHDHRACSSFLKDWHDGTPVQTIDVAIWTLDNAIGTFGLPHYCKIDVEGYELEVLKGLTTAIPLISFEYHLQKNGVRRAVECLDYLSTLGDLRVNITPAERLVFAQERWWDKDKFLHFFLEDVPHMRGYYYGDIFVKITAVNSLRFDRRTEISPVA